MSEADFPEEWEKALQALGVGELPGDSDDFQWQGTQGRRRSSGIEASIKALADQSQQPLRNRSTEGADGPFNQSLPSFDDIGLREDRGRPGSALDDMAMNPMSHVEELSDDWRQLSSQSVQDIVQELQNKSKDSGPEISELREMSMQDETEELMRQFAAKAVQVVDGKQDAESSDEEDDSVDIPARVQATPLAQRQLRQRQQNLNASLAESEGDDDIQRWKGLGVGQMFGADGEALEARSPASSHPTPSSAASKMPPSFSPQPWVPRAAPPDPNAALFPSARDPRQRDPGPNSGVPLRPLEVRATNLNVKVPSPISERSSWLSDPARPSESNASMDASLRAWALPPAGPAESRQPGLGSVSSSISGPTRRPVAPGLSSGSSWSSYVVPHQASEQRQGRPPVLLSLGLGLGGVTPSGKPVGDTAVSFIEPNAPAEGKVRLGDTIVAVDGVAATSDNVLELLNRRRFPGAVLTVSVLRRSGKGSAQLRLVRGASMRSAGEIDVVQHRAFPPNTFPIQGFLSAFDGPSQSWRRKYFALNGSTLSYYSDASKKAPLDSILLTRSAEVEVQPSELYHEPFAFTVRPHPDAASYLFAANSADKRIVWVRALLGAVQESRGRLEVGYDSGGQPFKLEDHCIDQAHFVF